MVGARPPFLQLRERERAAYLPGAPWEPPPGHLLAAREAALAETPRKPFPARLPAESRIFSYFLF